MPPASQRGTSPLMGPADKVKDNRPNSQKDLEARLAADHKGAREVAAVSAKEFTEQVATDGYSPYAVKGNDTDGYIGTDPVYQNYANDTHKPLNATEGAEAEAEDVLLTEPLVGKAPDAEAGPATKVVGSTVPTVYPAVSGKDYGIEKSDADEVAQEQKARSAALASDKPEEKPEDEAETADPNAPNPAANADDSTKQ